MNKNFFLMALCALAAAPAWSQQPAAADHSARHPPAAAAAAGDMTEGEVRRIDRAARKITLRHGEIRNLDMPPMTMVFQVIDAALLDKVSAGDKVRFRADQEAGNYRVIDLQRLP